MGLLSWFIPTNETKLRDVCGKGDVKAVKELLSAGADPNVPAKDGSTALINAAANEQTAIVRLLIDAGADVNARKGDNTVLCYAFALASAVAMQSLSRSDYPPSDRRREILKLLLKAGADPNNAPDGMTVLMLAAKHNDPRAVDLFLAHGADAKQVHDHFGGMTALTYAAAFGHAKLIPKLVAKGADVNFQAQAAGRWSALMHAAASGRSQHVPVVRALLAAGADKGLTNKEGKTALDMARDELARYPKPPESRKQIVSLLR